MTLLVPYIKEDLLSTEEDLIFHGHPISYLYEWWKNLLFHSYYPRSLWLPYLPFGFYCILRAFIAMFYEDSSKIPSNLN